MGITLEQAKALYHGQVLYHTIHTDSKGLPCKWRVAGAPKTWKTRPNEVRVPMRYGMQKTTEHLTESDLDLFEMSEWRATGTKITFKNHNDPAAGLICYMVVLGKIKVPYKKKYVDREIGEVWKSTEGKWYHGQSRHWFKTRQEAAEHLLDTMLD